MSAQGSAPRATLDLKVRVWGMGANNQPFFQNAMAQNISATGACIYGIEPELKVGDVIGVQYEGQKSTLQSGLGCGCGRAEEDPGRRSARGRSGLSVGWRLFPKI